VLERIRETRGGKLNDSSWGQRMTGSGEIADQIRSMFNVFRKKHGFKDLPKLVTDHFRAPTPKNGQMSLF
jgi:hypothetical protein